MTPPKLDPRSLDEIVAQTEALAEVYTADAEDGPWRPSGDTALDLGGALIRLFGRMVDHTIRQLNGIPDKYQRLFTGLIGATAIPPRAARAPVTFVLAPGDGTSEVPAGAQLAAGAELFETELALPLTRAALTAVYVRDRHDLGPGRYADRTAVALGQVAGPFAALAVVAPVQPADDPDNVAIEHELYVALDRLLALPGASALTLTADLALTSSPPPIDVQMKIVIPLLPTIAWQAWDGSAWTPIVSASRSPWVFPDLTRLHAREIDGVTARWLRGIVTTATSSPIAISAQITTTAPQLGALPDAVCFNSLVLDATRDFLPFGEQPQPGDAFYVSCDAAFGIAGAAVTLGVALTTPGAASSDLALAWERWDGARWVVLAPTDSTKAFTVAGTVAFSLTAAIPRSTVNGVPGRWIRARITRGNYGLPVRVTSWTPSPPTVAPSTLQPPLIGAIAVVCAATSVPADLTLVRRTALTYDPLPSDQAVVYRDAPDDDEVPALYLGFDRAFEPAVTTLYLEVAPPPAPEPRTYSTAPPPFQPPRLAWQYWSGQARDWVRLAIDDDTRDLARSGLVRFIPPDDAVAIERFGRTLHWLRVVPLDAVFAPVPQLARIATNTVWASHAVTTTRELLGSSSGARGQVFQLAQRPVLEGQRIEVGEPERPGDAELAQLQGEAGGAAVTQEGSVTWVRWHEVPDFWSSGPRDRHYTFDAATGTVTFGDGVNGMVPMTGTDNVRAAWYRAGGGAAGNVAPGAISQLKTGVALVDRVVNDAPAIGGAPLEPPEEMMSRAARTLRHGGRAVTQQDFSDLALEASRAVARAVTLTPSFSPIDWQDLTHGHELNRDGQVIVVIVPALAQPGRSPSTELLAEVAAYLGARCTPGVQLQVIGPSWVATDIDVRVASIAIDDSDAVLARVEAAIRGLLDPVIGGDGRGWDFGRRPRSSDIVSRIAAVPGVDHVSQIAIRCPPFDTDDFGGVLPGIDPLSLSPRLLFHARDVRVTASRREVP